jgi:siroheme synthase (precorrin-2 oxidase/ferrochelatase)
MTLATKLRDNKAVHAAAGAGDLAAEKIRELPETVTRLRETADRYRVDVRQTVVRYQDELKDTVTRYQDKVDARDLPGAAVSYVTAVGGRVVEIIDELAERGQKVVNRVDHQAATRELKENAQKTTRKTKAAVSQAKKTAQSASRAAGDAAKKIGG